MLDIATAFSKEWFWAMMQFVVISATLILIYIQVRIQTASHVVQSLSTIHTRWNSESMVRARNKVCTDWLAGRRIFDGVDEYVAEFLEELGTYVELKAIPPKAMWECQSWYIEHYFCMFKPGIDDARKSLRDPNLYIEFERLYKSMNEVNKKERSPALDHDEKALDQFAITEVQVTAAFLQLKVEERANFHRDSSLLTAQQVAPEGRSAGKPAPRP